MSLLCMTPLPSFWVGKCVCEHVSQSIMWWYYWTRKSSCLNARHWQIWGCTPPPSPKFLHFHAVFGKNWWNNRFAPPYRVGASLWKILDLEWVPQSWLGWPPLSWVGEIISILAEGAPYGTSRGTHIPPEGTWDQRFRYPSPFMGNQVKKHNP